MKIKFIVFAIGFATLMKTLASTNTLTYVIYRNAIEFAEATENLSEYDFESIPVGTNCKNYDFGDFTTDAAFLYAVNIQDENTHELYFNTSSYSQSMSLSFHNPIVAFGFDWRNTDNNSDMIRVDFDGTRYVLGSKDEVGFWGVVVTDGLITSDIPFLFGDTPGGSGWTAGNLDNLRYIQFKTTITNIQFADSEMILEWSANQSGLTYAVESCTNLNDGFWTLIQPTSQWWTTNTTWTNTQQTTQRRFFRVRAKQE